MISLSDESYYTEEPLSNDSLVIKSITILRSGDLSRTSTVRVSTNDITAIAGIDYKPKTEVATFDPGVAAVDFDVKILYDGKSDTTVELFKVSLGPQDPVSAIFGTTTSATVYIHPNPLNKNNNNEISAGNSKIEQALSDNKYSFGMPIVTSLLNLADKTAWKSRNYDIDANIMHPPGAPLVCLHVITFILIKFFKNFFI